MTTVVLERPRASGLVSWLTSTDHKRIALLTFATAGAFFVGSGILALLIRTELLEPGMQIMSHQWYNEVFTMHGSGMIYLVMTPIALALGLYLVPLQIGASGIMGPRLTLLGYWLYLCGGITMFFGFAVAGGAGKDGWFATYPLSSITETTGQGQDLWIIGVMLAMLGMTLQGATLLATLLARRAPGMTMMRMPPFSWTMLVTVLMTVSSFPVLVGTMAALEWDRLYGGIFSSWSYGAPAYQILFWFFGHPVVYVMFFPYVGCVAEATATFARRKFFGYEGFTLSMLLFAAGSMSVWVHHMFATGRVNNEFFNVTSTFLALPAGLEYFAIIGTMIGGVLLFSTPLLFSIGFLILFLLGGLSGIFAASPPLDYHITDSYFYIAHFHYTLFGGSLFGFFAGVYLWFPKVTGKFLHDGLGKLHFALLFVGTNLTFFPMFILGYDGMPRRVADYTPASGFQPLNIVASAGAYTIALGLLVFFVNLGISLRTSQRAGANPWGAYTLEWWTSSPPPRHNFASLPPVRSYAPLYDLEQEARLQRSRERLAIGSSTHPGGTRAP